MADTPARRPPPCSTLSFKREVLAGVEDRPGIFEAELIPELFTRGTIVRDKRVVVDHHQDHGIVWSIRNAGWSGRAPFGYLSRQQTPQQRRRAARQTFFHLATSSVSRGRSGSAQGTSHRSRRRRGHRDQCGTWRRCRELVRPWPSAESGGLILQERAIDIIGLRLYLGSVPYTIAR